MKRGIQLDPAIARNLAPALNEAPEGPEAVDRWLGEVLEGAACPFCHFAPITRAEKLSGRCERCQKRYLDAAEGGA